MKTLDNKFAHPRNDALGVMENYVMQSHYSVGKLDYVFPKPDHNNVVWGSYDITDPVAKKVIMKYKDSYNAGHVPLFTSSQIVRNASEDKYNVKEFDLMHTTLTDGPAFGEELSKIGAVCQGDLQQCVFKYGAAGDKSADLGMDIAGNVVDIYHTSDNCPFCIETELTNIFENNLKNSDYILNSASNLRMPETEEKGKAAEILQPDVDQSKDNPSRAPINTEELANNVAKKISELNKQHEISNTATDNKKSSDEKEVVKVTTSEHKEVDISNHPVVKKLEALVVDLANKVESMSGTVKEKDEKLSVLEARTQETEIGDLLAKYINNFMDPETGKTDPAKWEDTFKYLKDTKWTPKQIEALLEKISPYGTKERKVEVVTHKASTNRGVPKYNAAFGAEANEPPTTEEDEEAEEQGKDKEGKIHSASTNREISPGIRMIGKFVRSNDLD